MDFVCPGHEWRFALKVVWCLLSLAILLLLLSPFVFTDGQLFALSPKNYGFTHHHCPLCGMSRAFIAISRGNINQALAFNQLSPWLYALLLCNQLLLLLLLIKGRFLSRHLADKHSGS